MKRLLQKFDTAKALVPQPVLRRGQPTGSARSTSARPAGHGRGERELARAGHRLDLLRCAPSLPDSVGEFIAAHERCSWSSRTATRRCARC
jgi:2-oxoglutarate ferredoxin oxidoreductase subunit alpha